MTLCRLLPITHIVLTRGFVFLNCLTMQMKAVRSLETPRNTKPTTKLYVAFSAAPLYIPHVSHSIPFLLLSLHFKIIPLARIRLQFETLGVDAYICTYIYLYTFYRIFIWVLYLLGREKECVCIPSVAVFESLFVFLLLLCCERTFVSVI